MRAAAALGWDQGKGVAASRGGTRPQRGETVVQCLNIAKTFGGVHALRGVSTEFRAGEVTALLGDNGAGKSTLVKILGGMYVPDAGELRIGDERCARLTARDAADYGIEVVYQDLALCDNLTPTENIVLGREPLRKLRWPRLVDKRQARETARECVAALGANIPNWDAPVRELSGGQRQALAIARATISGHRMIVLDEPTAALGVNQTRATLDLVRTVASQGVAVVLIMHSIEQVFEVSDRIVLLRLGQVRLQAQKSQTSVQEVIAHMAGAAPASPEGGDR